MALVCRWTYLLLYQSESLKLSTYTSCTHNIDIFQFLVYIIWRFKKELPILLTINQEWWLTIMVCVDSTSTKLYSITQKYSYFIVKSGVK